MLLGAGGRSTGSPSGSQSQALSHTAGGAAAAAAAAVPGCRRRLREKATTEPACRGGLIHCGRLSLLLAWCCWAAGATAAASGGTAAVPAGGRARTAACGRACCGLPSHTAAIGCAAGAAGAALPPGLLSAPQPGCTCWCAASRAQYRQAPGTHRKSSSRGPCGAPCRAPLAATSSAASSPGANARLLASRRSAASCSRAAACHRRSVASAPQLARKAPQLDKAREAMAPPWPARQPRCAAACCPAAALTSVGRCHSRAAPSSPPVASRPVGACSSMQVSAPTCRR